MTHLGPGPMVERSTEHGLQFLVMRFKVLSQSLTCAFPHGGWGEIGLIPHLEPPTYLSGKWPGYEALENLLYHVVLLKKSVKQLRNPFRSRPLRRIVVFFGWRLKRRVNARKVEN